MRLRPFPSSRPNLLGGGEWRDGQHDDLVLAVPLAVWYGEEDTGDDYTPTQPSWTRGDDDQPYVAYDP